MIYGIGATLVALVLLLKGKFVWSVFDSIIAVLVVICVILWLTKGSRIALIASVAAGIIAAVPFIIMTWKSPASSPVISNTGFFLANTFAYFGAKTPTLQDRLYPGANAIACAFLVLPWLIHIV